MATITRISGDPLGVSQYELRLDDKVVVKSFDHNRPDDLPTLLRKAADAVIVARGEHGSDVYNVIKEPSADDALPVISDLKAVVRKWKKWQDTTFEHQGDDMVSFGVAISAIEDVITRHES